MALQVIFFILGLILVILSLKFGISTMKLNKMRGLAKGKFQLITEGIYKIMRHPMNTLWAVFFLGLALIFESLIALIIFPFFVLLLWLEGFLEEKILLIPLFGERYENYKEKTRYRMFPSPYNVLLILILIFIIYIYVLNMVT
ncbi:MAG: methyltransferase family protein [Promethearchaeota archaeon]